MKEQKEHKIKRKFKEFLSEEGAKLKDMTLGEKIGYIWDYYKVHIILTAFIIFFIVSISKVIYNNIKYEEVFHCAVVNSVLSTSEENYLREGFGEYINIDKEHDTLSFDSSYIFFWDNISSSSNTTYASRMKIAASLGAKTLDVFVADKTYIESGAPETQFADLSEVLPEDLYTLVEAYIFYAKDADGANRPFAVDLGSTHLAEEVFYQDPPYFAIVANTEHMELAIEFLKYAFEVEQ